MQLLMGMFSQMSEVERLMKENAELRMQLDTREPDVRDRNYRAFVDRLYVKRREDAGGMLHPAIGMAGEAGEVLDLVKKTWAYEKPIDREKLIEEMGDLYHYMTMMMIVLDIDLGDLIENNTAKLKKRYPDGYSDQAAIERKDKAA